MKNFFLWILLIFNIFYCTSQNQRLSPSISDKHQDIEKIDCNYFWPARQVHVCIKEMPKKECEMLFSMGQFIKEEDCYCDIHKKEKNTIKTETYVQYDCRN